MLIFESNDLCYAECKKKVKMKGLYLSVLGMKKMYGLAGVFD